MRAAISSRVQMRNGTGRFAAQCSEAAARTVAKAIEEGADLSRDMAPIGGKADARTIPLKDSIESHQTGRTSGYWVATARHALPTEYGAGPHQLPGNVSFFWEEQGRMWEPGDNQINHPGSPAQPYLRPAYRIVMRNIMRWAKRYYPN